MQNLPSDLRDSDSNLNQSWSPSFPTAFKAPDSLITSFPRHAGLTRSGADVEDESVRNIAGGGSGSGRPVGQQGRLERGDGAAQGGDGPAQRTGEAQHALQNKQPGRKDSGKRTRMEGRLELEANTDGRLTRMEGRLGRHGLKAHSDVMKSPTRMEG